VNKLCVCDLGHVALLRLLFTQLLSERYRVVRTLQIKYISTNTKYFCLQTYSTRVVVIIIIIIIIITFVALADR